ncbi:MAG: hypothetical protein FWD58_08345 [Firmicutes bacterium]|nr:hypothetical protein [Bacillota bacterium]
MHPLEKLSKEAGDYVTEKNRPWFENLMEEHHPGYKEQQRQKEIRKRRLRLIWISLSSSMVTVAVVISLVFLWPLMFPTTDSPPGKHYLLENEESTISSLSDLNADIQNFFLELDVGYESKIRHWFDSVSGDTLYYELDLGNQDTLETIIIYIYINPYYENKEDLKDINPADVNEIAVGEFIVMCNKVVEDKDWAFLLSYRAVSEHNGVTIYIEYEQLSLDEESNFFNFFEQTFRPPGHPAPAASDLSKKPPGHNPEVSNISDAPPETPSDNPSQDPPVKHYAFEDEITVASNLTELNSVLQIIRVEFAVGYEANIERILDSASGDTLYYRLTLDNPEMFEAIIVYIYINPDYENRNELPIIPDISQTTFINDFLLSYNESIVEDGIFFLTIRAAADISGIALYLEYDQLSLTEESNFLNFFSQTFQVL